MGYALAVVMLPMDTTSRSGPASFFAIATFLMKSDLYIPELEASDLAMVIVVGN